MNRESLVQHLEAVVTPVLVDLGFQLVDLQVMAGPGRQTVQLRIERTDVTSTVTIDDCANVSRALSGVLDVEAQIPGAYNLEVSSPGLDRPLKRCEDFLRFCGHQITVKTRDPIDGRRHFKGVLRQGAAEQIQIEVDQQLILIPLAAIERARLADPLVMAQPKKVH